MRMYEIQLIQLQKKEITSVCSKQLFNLHLCCLFNLDDVQILLSRDFIDQVIFDRCMTSTFACLNTTSSVSLIKLVSELKIYDGRNIFNQV